MPAVQASVQPLFHSFYSDHHRWLHAWLRKKLGCADTAADLAHDAFLRILSRQEHNGFLEAREPRAYLTTIARGLLVDFFRRADLERAWLADVAALPEALQPSPEERLDALQTLQAIDRLLQAMTPKTRAAWLLSRIDGLTHTEIAAELGVSVPRVRQYLANAARQAYHLRFSTGAA